MCGIYGYIGDSDSVKICLDGLKLLEYRGYDSAGITGINSGEFVTCKEIGKIAELEKSYFKKPLPLDLAIAHTRWATHGIPTKENAHPHFDQNETIAIVHNGIIENHHDIRTMLKAKGFTFNSDTDTEVIAQLVSSFYKGDLFSAVQQALALMHGSWGIALIHKAHPNQIIASAKDNPLAIGIDPETKEAYISSDANTFQRSGLKVTFLQKGEIAVVTAGKLELFNNLGLPVERPSVNLEQVNFSLNKNGFEHFMLKEIFEQPHTVQQAVHNRYDLKTATAIFEELTFTTEELRAFKSIKILACGTSWHAGSLAALLLEELARIPAHAEIGSEFRTKDPLVSPETLIIAISQSGETLDTLAAVREAKKKGAKVLAICNVANSSLVREADSTLFLRAGPEISVCSTKAFTSQISVLVLFAILMGRLRQMTHEEAYRILSDIDQIQTHVNYVLNQNEAIQRAAKKYANFNNFFFLGRHYMYPAAIEAALKLKEISYINANGYPAGELKHGPISLLEEKVPVVGMLGNKRTYDKMLSSMMEVKSRRSPIIAFAPKGAEQIEAIADILISLPQIADELACIPYSIACQLFAYYIAKERGTDIDQPRNLAKSVTVE